MTFEDDLKAAQTPEDNHIDVLVLIAKKPYTLRFRQMDGMAWAAETDRHVPRPGVVIDARYGYNIRSLTRGAAPQCGVLVTDDGERELRVDPYINPQSGEPILDRVDEWADVFKALSGHDFKRVTDAIWTLNEYTPQQDIEAAGKELAGSANSSH